jgi:integrase
VVRVGILLPLALGVVAAAGIEAAGLGWVLQAVRGDRREALFTVALACGLRQSETLGLRWSDVNVDAATLTIQRTMQRVSGAFTFFPPKTARSRRTIAMPSHVATALRQHMKRQLEERMVMGAAGCGTK